MTAQIAENLCFEGRSVRMSGFPLETYFAFGGRRPEIGFDCALSGALCRGYVGQWEIAHDRLYLVGLRGTLCDGTPASLASVFPDYPDRVFAHWYAGELRIPEGKLLSATPKGLTLRYERVVVLSICNGMLMARRTCIQGKDPAAHGPAAFDFDAQRRIPVLPKRRTA